MTLENLYFFMAGITLTSLGVYASYLFMNMKKIAREKNSQALEASMFTTKLADGSSFSISNSNISQETQRNLWNKPHCPRLEDMF